MLPSLGKIGSVSPSCRKLLASFLPLAHLLYKPQSLALTSHRTCLHLDPPTPNSSWILGKGLGKEGKGVYVG